VSNKILFPKEEIITTKLFNVAQDWEVPIAGFFIVAPLRKIKSISEFTDEEAIEFINLIKKVRKGMRQVLKIEEVYLFQNEDTEHGFHFWIFPRFDWMEKFGRKIQSVRPIINYAKENMLDQKIDAPPRLKRRGLIGARFLKNKLVFEGHRNVGALRDLDARRSDHTLKSVVSGRNDRHDNFLKEVRDHVKKMRNYMSNSC